MTGTIGRRAVLAVYAVVVIVPLLVVLTGTFKTTPQLFSSPFGLPSSLEPAQLRHGAGPGQPRAGVRQQQHRHGERSRC